MSGEPIDPSSFRDVLLPNETLLWSAKPVMRPRSAMSFAALAGVSTVGLLGAAQMVLAFLNQFVIWPEALPIVRHIPRFNGIVGIVLAIGAAAMVYSSVADRRRTRSLVYALSNDRIFRATVGRSRLSASAATRLAKGQLVVTRRSDLLDISIEVIGKSHEDEWPAQFTLYGLAVADGESALNLLRGEAIT